VVTKLDIDTRTTRDRRQDAELYRAHKHILNKMPSFGMNVLWRAWAAFERALTEPPASCAAPTEWLSTTEAAALALVSRQCIRDWIARHPHIGRYVAREGRYVVSRRALRAYLLARSDGKLPHGFDTVRF
jgi:hypothetical protein